MSLIYQSNAQCFNIIADVMNAIREAYNIEITKDIAPHTKFWINEPVLPKNIHKPLNIFLILHSFASQYPECTWLILKCTHLYIGHRTEPSGSHMLNGGGYLIRSVKMMCLIQNLHAWALCFSIFLASTSLYMRLNIQIYKDTVPWPPIFCTFINWTFGTLRARNSYA